MDKGKVGMYISKFKNYVPYNKQIILKNALEKADAEAESNLAMVRLWNPFFIFICSIFLSALGIDRIIIGDVGLGVCKLLFGWLTLFIWPFVDIFLTYKKAKEKNLQNILLVL